MIRRSCYLLTVPLALALAGCNGGGEDDDTGDPTGDDDSSATPGPTPEAITVADGTYGLWNAYIFSNGGYTLEPRGTLTVVSTVISGQVVWRVFASSDDYVNGNALCTYVNDVAAEADLDFVHNDGCEGCGVYYRVTLTPGVDPDLPCPDEAVDAIYAANGTGLDDEDTWGFSLVSEDQWPSRWYSLSSWETRQAWLIDHDASYAIWSREWHDNTAAYLPLWATYDPDTLTPIPDSN